MNLVKIDLERFKNIICDFAITDDNTILYINVSGNYKSGSEGNFDGLYLFSLISAYYFVYEPVCIIIDLRNLRYTWGNTILKALNFFNEVGRDDDERKKLITIIYSSENQSPITDLLKMASEGNRILCGNFDEAIAASIKNVQEYLESQ
mgnify:CR=1 FL=1|jgi:hypothetical protein